MRLARPSLRARLLALVLVPTLLFGVVAGLSAQAQWHDAARARQVQGDVSDLAGLVDLKSALLLARVPVEVDVRSSSIGIDRATARDLLGLQASQVGSIADVTSALRRLPERDQPFEAEQVEALAAQAGRGSSAAVLERFDELDALADRVWERQLLDLRYEIVRLGDPRLASQLTDLENAAVVGTMTAALITELADYWFPVEASDSREAARVAIGISDARLDRSLAALASSPDDAIARAAADLSTARAGTFGQAVDAAVDGPTGEAPTVEVAQAAATFTSSFDLFAPIVEIVESLSTGLEASADASANDSTRIARQTLAVAVAVPALVLVASLLLAASFERPLGRLIEGLRRVGHGRLDTRALTPRGPPELRVAASAFNDVVENLQMVDQKVRLLAEPQPDDALVDQPLPGELGRTLTGSFEVLDESLRDRASLHDELAHRATHDQLTGIANRAGILAALERAVSRLDGSDGALLVAFLDLDRFKAVNDTRGHRHGDEVLRQVAARLANHARAGDVAGRLGGDEFVLVAEHIPNQDIAVALGRRIAAAVRRPIAIGGDQTTVGVSIGLALADSAEETAAQLLHRADRAVYAAKRSDSGIAVSTGPEPSARPSPLTRVDTDG